MALSIYKEHTLVAPKTVTAAGDSGELAEQFVDVASLRVQLAVTAISGTSPSLAVTIEDTLDGVNWNVVGTFAAKTAVGTEVINITSPIGRRLRVRHAITGTSPSATFNVVAVSRGGVS